MVLAAADLGGWRAAPVTPPRRGGGDAKAAPCDCLPPVSSPASVSSHLATFPAAIWSPRATLAISARVHRMAAAVARPPLKP
jgi:hypothetical protein